MGIEKLTSTLLKEGEEEANKIVETAKWHVQKMIEEERAKQQERKKAVEEEVKKLFNDERNERLAWARLEGKRIIAEAKEDSIKRAMDELYDLIPEIRKSDEYASWLAREVEKALKELGGKAVVRIVKGDKKLLSKIKGEIEENLDALGGAVVESTNGKIRVDLRLETFFERHSDAIRKKLAAELFES